MNLLTFAVAGHHSFWKLTVGSCANEPISRPLAKHWKWVYTRFLESGTPVSGDRRVGRVASGSFKTF